MSRFFILVLICFRLNPAFAQGIVNYRQLTAFPGTARDDAAVFILHDDVYVVGGLDVNFIAQNDVWKYSASDQAWQQLPGLPAAGRLLSKIVSINGRHCLIGGVTGGNTDLAECWCYNGLTQSWESLSYPPVAGRRQHAAISLHDNIYFGLGMNAGIAHKDWWSYKKDKSSWERQEDFPGGDRKEPVTAAWGESVFVGLGVSANDSVAYRDFYRFDEATQSWKKLSDYPGFACQYIACMEVSDGILIVSGINEEFEFSREVYLYKPDKDLWVRLDDYPFPAKKGAGAASQGNSFYMVCGVDETVMRSSDMIKGEYVPGEDEALVFPNPFTAELYIKYNHDFEYALYNASGALVAKDRAAAGLNELAFPQLEKGIYFLLIRQDNGSTVKKKLVKD